jgi:DNA-binding MarR family transcriptional regulator
VVEDGAQAIEERLVAALERLALAIDLLLRRGAREHDMSPLQVHALVSLHREEGARRRLREMSREWGCSTAAVRQALEALLARGFAERPPGEHDARTIRLLLTPAGRSVGDSLSQWAEPLRRAVARTGPRTAEAVLPALVEWIAALHRAHVLPGARVCPTCRFFAANVHADAGSPHQCELFGVALGDADLRVDCPEHQPL